MQSMCSSVQGFSRSTIRTERAPAATALAKISCHCRCPSLAENNPSNISLDSLGMQSRATATLFLQDSPAMLASCLVSHMYGRQDIGVNIPAFLLSRHWFFFKKKIHSSSSAPTLMCRVLQFSEFTCLHTR